ncbi:MAG: PAS domain S-box protein [Thermodesulfobacteriota bacterium]
MDDESRPREELLREIQELRRELDELRAREGTWGQAQGTLPGDPEGYRNILAGLEDGYYEVDLAGNFTFFNEAMSTKILGCRPEELLRANYRQYLDEDNARAVYHAFNQVFMTGRPIKELGWTLIRQDGSLCSVEASVSLVRKAQGEPTGFRGIVRDVTERKKAEEARRESEERYRLLMEASPDAVVVYDPQGRVTYINKAFERVYGWTREELLGRTIDFVPPPEKGKTRAALRRAVEGARDIIFETQRLTKSGRLLDVELRSTSVFDRDGWLAGSIVIHRDITERKRSEEALRQSEERYRLLLDASPDAITVYDHEGKVTYVNPAFAQTFGWTIEELAGRGIDFVPPHEMAKTAEAVARTLRGETVLLESQRLTRDGRLLDIQLKTAIFKDREGKLAGDIVIYRDITARKKAEDELKRHRDRLEELVTERTRDLRATNIKLKKEIEERKQTEKALLEAEARYRTLYEVSKKAEELYRSLFNSSADAIVVYDLEGHVQYLNPAFTQVFGWTLEEVLGRKIDFVPEREEELTNNRVAEVIEDGRTLRDFETRRLTKDGRVLDVNISASRYNDHEGRPAGMLVLLRDTTEKAKMEAEVRRWRNYLQEVIDSMPSVLIGVDPEERVTNWNARAREVTGLSFEEVLGRSLPEVYPLAAEQIDLVRECLVRSQPRELEKLAQVLEGELRYVATVVYPLAADHVIGAVLRIDDVTDRVRIEEMMVQTEKMMSVGGLAAGMAHEINNPLGGVIQGVQNIKRRLSPELAQNLKAAQSCGTELEKVQAYLAKRQITDFLEGILNSGQRAAKIVANMLEFSRHSKSEMQLARLDELLDKTVELAASDYDLKKQYDFRHIEVVRDFDPEVPPVFCDPTKIEQVILNLLKNAAQAMSEGRVVTGRSPRLVLRTRREESWTRIEIEDNGPGMDENVRRRIFEPFFTTKKVGYGTGLGLSVSYFIVTDTHQGRLSVESTPGKGTKFIMHLPLEKRKRE